MLPSCFFFFQAEDGIRDSSVTGVQTCALPISKSEVVECITWPIFSFHFLKKLFTYLLRSEEHTSELQSHLNLVCRLLLEKKNKRHRVDVHIGSIQKRTIALDHMT